MKYFLIAVAVIVVGFIVFRGFGSKTTQTPQTAQTQSSSPSSDTGQLPPGVVLATWRQQQACPQYGGAKQCYVQEGAYGGYDNWAATRATFIWKVNPCPDGKKVIKINQGICRYETNGVEGKATTTVDKGSAVVDCRQFAAQYKNDDCNCNNGITLIASVQCQ